MRICHDISVNDKFPLIQKSFLIIKCIKQIKNWQIPVLSYLGIINSLKIVILKNNTKCIIRNKNDTIAFLENFILEANTSHEIFKIMEKDTVVDIGAHVGYFTLYAANLAKKGKIISYEPSKKSFLILEKNIKINNFSNIKLENVAISKTHGKALLHTDDHDEISNSLYNLNKKSKVYEVETNTLEEIFLKNKLDSIDFLKIDCEGAEYEILMNASSLDLDKIKKMSIEIHEKLVPYSKEAIIEKLVKHGFNVKLETDISGIRMELPLLLAWK
jgi:FkbM family methyltransferase